jgi:hypothetical protein
MVLTIDNLMALPASPRAAGSSEDGRFRVQTRRDHESNLKPTG